MIRKESYFELFFGSLFLLSFEGVTLFGHSALLLGASFSVHSGVLGLDGLVSTNFFFLSCECLQMPLLFRYLRWFQELKCRCVVIVDLLRHYFLVRIVREDFFVDVWSLLCSQM